MLIFDADHPLVLNGTYDREGYTPTERRAQERRRRQPLDAVAVTYRCDHKFMDSLSCLKCGWTPRPARQPKGPTMRLFDDDAIGCYLDDIGHRAEKGKDGSETKMVDLTLRVQPFTPELAASLDPDVRALLFNMSDAQVKAKIKALHFNLPVPNQSMQIRLLPESDGRVLLSDVEISDPRARTEKGVDGYALVFYASFGPVSAHELEYICEWLTQQRFVTFEPQNPALDFDADQSAADAKPEPARRVPRRNVKQIPVDTGDELRPGIHAEH